MSLCLKLGTPSVNVCLFFLFPLILLCSVHEIENRNLALDTCLSDGSFFFDSIEKLSFTFLSVDKIEDKQLLLAKKPNK